MRLLLEVRRSEEALDYLQDYLAAHSSIEKDKSDAISLVEEFTASGHAEEALQVLRHSPSAMFLEPLKVALQIDVGEDVAAAVEVREVANDIVQRIKKRRAELQDTKPDLRRILLLHKQWLDSDGGEGKRADLTDADLRRVHLCRANLRGAKLCGSNLRKANLRNADLRNADLRNADLKEADLRGANLTATDLTNADLQGIDLRGANLKHAKLKTHQLEKIITDGTTILPIPSKSPRKYAPQY